eukprot:630563-Prorocentrum_minimum.AAC.1
MDCHLPGEVRGWRHRGLDDRKQHSEAEEASEDPSPLCAGSRKELNAILVGKLTAKQEAELKDLQSARQKRVAEVASATKRKKQKASTSDTQNATPSQATPTKTPSKTKPASSKKLATPSKGGTPRRASERLASPSKAASEPEKLATPTKGGTTKGAPASTAAPPIAIAAPLASSPDMSLSNDELLERLSFTIDAIESRFMVRRTLLTNNEARSKHA